MHEFKQFTCKKRMKMNVWEFAPSKVCIKWAEYKAHGNYIRWLFGTCDARAEEKGLVNNLSAVDLHKRPKQIQLPILIHSCAPLTR